MHTQVEDEASAPPRQAAIRGWDLVWAAVFLLIAAGLAAYLHWPALTDPLIYKSDVKQAPHWSAYHTDTFRDDDLLLTLAAHNESPLLNLTYYLGTFVVDMVTLGKWLTVAGYGLTAALFFLLMRALYGRETGAMAALCFTFFPDQFGYFAGGFSKAWMIPVLLVCVFLIERERWRGFLWLMPFGALAYPVSAVMTGAVLLTFIVLEAPTRRRQLQPAFGYLCAASALAISVLAVKYVFPPDGIGSLTPSHVLRDMPEMYHGGFWPYLPLPSLTSEMSSHLRHPFILLSAAVFIACLSRGKLAWSRPLTALLVASLSFYLIADLVFMNLYQPNRYTRYSMAVLLAIWHGRNWVRVSELLPWRVARIALLATVVAAGLHFYHDDYRVGKDTSPRHRWVPLNEYLATLPPKVLIAGPPKYMDDIPIQARRSVLCNYKLAHPWYSEYYPEIKRRTHATFDALYATEPGPVNRLHEEWGVTHLVVVKRYLTQRRIRARNTYVDPYDDYIYEIAAKTGSFLLSAPPAESIAYHNEELFVVALPLPTQ